MGLQMDFSMLGAMDILDIAIFVENEAEDHYEQLETWARARGNESAAAFFKRMAGFEVLHRRQIADLRQELFGDTPPRYTDSAAWDVEAPDWDAVGPTLTLRQAMEIGVEAETKAHDYYEGAKEWARDARVEELLDTLARAELMHRRLIEDEMARLEDD